MTRYELSRDKSVTVAALVLDVFCVLSCVLLADSLLGDTLGIQTVMSKHISPVIAIIIALVIQYLLLGVELIARYREEIRGFTFPIVFIPGGHILRFVFMVVIELLPVLIRLLAYFLSVLVQIIGIIPGVRLIFRLLSRVTALDGGTFVDNIDGLLEPLDWFVNRVYNVLYYNKIQQNGNVFNAVFNCNLTFWCINH